MENSILSYEYAKQITSELKSDYILENNGINFSEDSDGCIIKVVKNSIYICRIGFWIRGGKPNGPGIYLTGLANKLNLFIEHSNPDLIQLINNYIDEVAKYNGV